MNTDNDSLSPKRRRRITETSEYHLMMLRCTRAYERRVAVGDIDALPGMVNLADDLEHRTRGAVHGLLAKGFSWTDIGRALGISRQGARQRWMDKA